MTLPVPSIITSRRLVPNQQPLRDPGTSRIAIIGEAPGEDEENYGVPFCGKSGQFFTGILQDVGIDRKLCFVGNVCQTRPPNNEITRFPWDGTEIQSGLTSLATNLSEFRPHICVLVGNAAIHAAKRGRIPPRRTPKGAIDWPCKIGDHSGYLFSSSEPTSPFFTRKCISGFHPAGILRQWDHNYPRLKAALRRALDESSSPSLVLPHRELITTHSATQLCHLMNTWPTGQKCCVDIEGGLPNSKVNDGVRKDSKKRRYIGWRCVALSSRPTSAFAIAWWKFTEDEHMAILHSFARLMSREDVPKILQNGLYDNFVLTYGYGILIRGVTEETMLSSWEVYAELPRALSVQASIWTREPHWKDEEMYESTGENLAIGCCKDVAVTYEICEAQAGTMSEASKKHYRKMVELLNPFHYMEQRGMLYDQENVRKRSEEVSTKGWEEISREGVPKRHEPLSRIRERLAQVAGYDLCGETSLSHKKLAKCLYQEKGYPPQYKKENGRKTDKFTTDIEALLALKRHRDSDNFLSDILLHRHLEGVRETLNILPDPDGRVRCRYSLEAETGRVKCYESPTGAGANLQTIQKLLRTNYIADPGFDFGQFDLEGADGWTVAAHAARLGDSNMLDDYMAGMKPAKIIALLYWFGSDINKLSRTDLKWFHDTVFPEVKRQSGEWLYLGCKRVQHGSSYLMGIPTMQLNVLKDSFKESGTPIYMEASEARSLQSDCMFARYPGVQSWHRWAEATLVSTGQLTAASGHTRIFFGRRFGKDISETVKEFLAHEPQNNTTWATSLALLNLWNDSANRVREVYPHGIRCCDEQLHLFGNQRPPTARWLPGSLLIEPLHQVHDALCVQWPQFVRRWACSKMKEYFNNVLTIAGRQLTIPFDGGWGPSWGDCKNPL